MYNFSDDIKDRLTMFDICERYGLSVNRQHNAICPFHDDRHASMHIYGGRGGFHCYSCDQGGDVIDFVQRYFSLGFSDACAKINEDFQLGLPIGRRLTLREMREAERAARERKAKRDAEAAEHKRLLDDYHAALDAYTHFDRQRLSFFPVSVGEIPDEYAEAVRILPYAEHLLNLAETRLTEYEHKSDRCGNC